MLMSLRSSRARIRSLAPALLMAVVFLGSADSLLGQVTTGLNITKTCPQFAASGSTFQCTFTVQNQDPANSVISLAVTNEVPFPGGTITGLGCLNVAGQPVNALNPLGTVGDTCGGTIDETAPLCGPATIVFTDQVAATGTDTNGGGTPLPVSATTTNQVEIAPCPGELIPTLSFPMMALLGVLLAGTGLFLARRH